MLGKDELMSYFAGIRKRTMMYVNEVPESLIDWRFDENKFSIGDIIRHLGSVETMFYHALKGDEWSYPGHGADKGHTKREAIAYLQQCHQTVMEGLSSLEPEHFTKKVPSLAGHEMSAWRLIMALGEHEIHHRGQLSAYMQANQVNPPQIFGLKIEQVPQQSSADPNRESMKE